MANVPRGKYKAWRKAVYDLRANGNTLPEIVKITGKSLAMVKRALKIAVEDDGLPPLDMPAGTAYEHKNPEKAGEMIAEAALIDTGSEHEKAKLKALREAMKDAGLPPGTIAGFMKRLRTTFAPVMAEAGRLTTAELIKQLEQKMVMTLGYMDEFAVSQAGFKDLSIAMKIFIENHQLLSGKPTMILDHTTRQTVNQLLPQLVAEANRRGLTIDNPPQHAFAPTQAIESVPAP